LDLGIHNKEQLIKDWKQGRAPLDYFDPSSGDFDGKIKQVETAKEPDADAFIHTHTTLKTPS